MFGVFFTSEFSPILPIRHRARKRSFFRRYLLVALLHEVVAQLLQRRCNFLRYNTQLLFYPATIAREIAEAIRSNRLHSTESHPEYDRSRIPRPPGHPPTSPYRPNFAPG